MELLCNVVDRCTTTFYNGCLTDCTGAKVKDAGKAEAATYQKCSEALINFNVMAVRVPAALELWPNNLQQSVFEGFFPP